MQFSTRRFRTIIKYPGRSVNDIIKDGFPVSFKLGIEAILIAIIIGIPAGILAGVKKINGKIGQLIFLRL